MCRFVGRSVQGGVCRYSLGGERVTQGGGCR